MIFEGLRSDAFVSREFTTRLAIGTSVPRLVDSAEQVVFVVACSWRICVKPVIVGLDSGVGNSGGGYWAGVRYRVYYWLDGGLVGNVDLVDLGFLVLVGGLTVGLLAEAGLAEVSGGDVIIRSRVVPVPSVVINLRFTLGDAHLNLFNYIKS